jgi:hypothetical protein
MNELATAQHLEWVETRRTRVGGTAPRESASRVSSSVARAVVMSPRSMIVVHPKSRSGSFTRVVAGVPAAIGTALAGAEIFGVRAHSAAVVGWDCS